ncbi:hypothetical protein LQZ18_18535 [Lachnospiraceae bacterium ZAX-1]
MELCYDGALVMPSNWVAMDEDEMMYVEGGYKITLNRAIIATAFVKVIGTVGKIAARQWLKTASGKAIAGKITSSVLGFGKSFLASGGFAAFAVEALAFALAGVLVVSAVTIGIIYATDKTVTLGF